MLDRGGVEARADFAEQGLAAVSFDAVDAHLDQFMRLEAAFDFGKDGVAETVLADAGDGAQTVGAGAQCPALG